MAESDHKRLRKIALVAISLAVALPTLAFFVWRLRLAHDLNSRLRHHLYR